MTTFVTIVRCDAIEMTDDSHRAESDAINHAERQVARLDPRYSIAVIACDRVTNYQYGSAVFYEACTGTEIY